MGTFHVRCKLSGLSTRTFQLSEDPDELARERATGLHDSWVVLLEERGGRHVPLAPPVRGVYDQSGALQAIAPSPVHTAVSRRLWKLWDSRALTASDRTRMTQHAQRRDPLEAMLRLFADVFSEGLELTLRGRKIRSALVLGPVADALSREAPVAADEDAYSIAFPDGSLAEPLWATLGRSAGAAVQSLAALTRWAEARGGWKPTVAADMGQPDDGELRAMGRRAWDLEDPVIQGVLKRHRPAWVAIWRSEGAVETSLAPLRARAQARPYRPSEAYEAGELIEHAKFGTGHVLKVIDPKKIEVEFETAIKTLGQRMT